MPDCTFDGPRPFAWGVDAPATEYDVDMHPGDGGFNPSLVIGDGDVNWYFIQSHDDKGAFAPGYAIAESGGAIGDFDDEDVRPWMRQAIERAGFRYDPIPNSERRTRRDVPDPNQTSLEEVAHD